jgi:uncharacterized membrane protein YedE/YeeE
VMGGALAVAVVGFRMLPRTRERPVFGGEFELCSRRGPDGKLYVGTAVFGIGWALGGLCPGPAIANLARGDLGVVAFFGTMLVGMFVAQSVFRVDRR